MKNTKTNQKENSNKHIRYSQNLLTSKKTIEQMLKLSNIGKEDFVIEIGPGKGHITKELLNKCGNLQAVELDKNLYAKLKQGLGNHSKLQLINQDFLKINLPTNQSYKVFSNIPYFITTDIIRKLTQTGTPPKDIWLVMEKGAAKRFCGKPAENLQSLLLKPFWELSIIYHLKKEDFHPMPSVDSVMLYMKQKKKPDLMKKEYAAYQCFLSRAFRHGVYGAKGLLTKRQVSAALRYANLPQIEPSGIISYVQWLCLFRYYQKLGKK
jgi:23S rRNA (adenine-N6)-dimethyltransferase